jgi:hypothetical protein
MKHCFLCEEEQELDFALKNALTIANPQDYARHLDSSTIP